MQAFQDMSPIETVFFVLLVYSPYYLPILLALWLLLIGLLIVFNKRRAAKRAGVVLIVAIGILLMLSFLTGAF